MGIGLKFKKLLSIRGKTVGDVAKATGIPPSTLYSIISRDNNKIDIDMLFVLSDELGVKVDYFSEKNRLEDEEFSNEFNNEFAKEINILKERKGLQALVLSSSYITDEEIEDAFKIIEALK